MKEMTAISTVMSQSAKGLIAPQGSMGWFGRAGNRMKLITSSTRPERSSGQVRRGSQASGEDSAARNAAVATPPAMAGRGSPTTAKAPSAKASMAATSVVAP